MKKLFLILALLLLLLVGCQDPKNGTLDTSKLNKVEMKDVTKEQKKNIPITYKAPSVKVGLDALPFEMKLPGNLPFDAKPFQAPIINDQNHDGKKLSVEFTTSSKRKEDKIFLRINAFNEEFLETNQELEKINLNKKHTGYYNNNLLNFHSKGISYTIVYMNEKISKEQHKKEIAEMANQILE
ncbi:hypothetical protein RCG23_01480 [Neobacillus sp. PS3-34]|uniref:hypothetical protein n=1 Tax=Neobacillus sp. PS3-34 TaxID=3070678 RepID=UPI0027E1D2EB|nr:hypothetical protein [Neobacillus sp. PS3-34]WML48830.1 hypothetical protein RCG23_01480 [Neobacillus sp. PS3-34]